MAPPPSTPTPTPRRFLAPKRSATQRSNETPRPLRSGAQQFQATPRFSLHSTPRDGRGPSHFSSTPAASAAFARQPRPAENISDSIDAESSPPELDFGGRPPVGRSIDIESETQSLSGLEDDGTAAEQDAEQSGSESRSPKRRRLSVASSAGRDPSSPPVLQEKRQDDVEFDASRSTGSESEDSEDVMQLDTFHNRRFVSGAQPATSGFQKAPRFRHGGDHGGAPLEPLPDAFSPHRRGTKYVPGGLSSELRDWLMEIEAGTGPKKEGEWSARLAVSEARASLGMILVKGWYVLGHETSGEAQGRHASVKVILAGDGRLTALAKRNEVFKGTLVGISKPFWETAIGKEGQWLVVCDWAVLQ